MFLQRGVRSETHNGTFYGMPVGELELEGKGLALPDQSGSGRNHGQLTL
jgi:hypothetical protein